MVSWGVAAAVTVAAAAVAVGVEAPLADLRCPVVVLEEPRFPPDPPFPPLPVCLVDDDPVCAVVVVAGDDDGVPSFCNLRRLAAISFCMDCNDEDEPLLAAAATRAASNFLA